MPPSMRPFALTGGHLGALERPLVSARGECGPSPPFALTPTLSDAHFLIPVTARGGPTPVALTGG